MNQTQAIIILLLVANLAATIWFGSQKIPPGGPEVTQSSEQHALPRSITPEKKQSYLETFSEAFNKRDMDALYNLFGPAAKAQLSREEIDGQFDKLIQLFGKIEGGAFTHSKLVSKQGSTDIYTLYYAVRFPQGGNFGTHGTLKITLAIEGDNAQIYGIYVTAGTNIQ